MLPSARIFLNRDNVYAHRRARQRARWLYDYVAEKVDSSKELADSSPPDSVPDKNPTNTKPFPPRRWLPAKWRADEQLIDGTEWRLVAEVAEHYPRLLTWLSEGQVGVLWNVFGVWVSVLRLIPVARWLLWRVMFKPVADRAPWRGALYEAILQQRRHEENRKLERKRQEENIHPEGKNDAEDTLSIPGSGIVGLGAVTDEAVIMRTKARADLHARIVDMSSGCIGISGPRGAGKSTLIQEFCAHRYGTPREPGPDAPKHFLPGMRVMVQAPLRFDAREFLIHQYTCLCRAVLADVRFNPTTFARQVLVPLVPGRIRPTALLGAISGAVLFAGCGVLAYLASGGHWPDPLRDLRDWEIAGAVITGIAGMIAIGWRTRRAMLEIRQIVNLASDAEGRLSRLHYQRTDSRASGGTLSAPMGAGISVGTSHEFTQQLMSLPELIDDYLDFVERVVGGLEYYNAATARPERVQAEAAAQDNAADPAGRRRDKEWHNVLSEGVRLVIGIDQVDLIDDVHAACQFLDELNAAFGTRHCVYLIAVSPSTLAAVDQRTVPLKTSSGGIFDEMIWVEPFGLEESNELLNDRVIGLPPILIALCYVLSGGLPRDLLRVARSIVRAAQQPTDPDDVEHASIAEHPGINEIVDLVIKDEIRALKQRAQASIAAADVTGTSKLLENLTSADWPWERGGANR